MESAESSLVPGYRLDRYELLCPIASGGMASVWLARLRGKRGFEKLYAIKTIRTELISDPNFQEMFLDEARIAARIIHPNVAQILELGEQEDILYIVMEYVDGDSLAKINRLANKLGAPLPAGVAMRIVAEICAGLHAAHQLKDRGGESLGVVHRDVSPQNVLLTTDGQAKVIDFGLVKAKNRSAAETQSGVVKGKIRYMAPEQVSGKSVDRRADVWACGMCLYELVTGLTPYGDIDDLEVVKRLIANDHLPAFDVALAPAIERIVTRATVIDPEGRFESCAAMRRAIEATIHELGLAAETDDVAEFVKGTLPDLATKRQRTIAKAIEAADGRRSTVSAFEGLGPGDIGYAATEVSSRDVAAEDVMPLTRKRGASLPPPTRREGQAAAPAPALDSDGGRTVSSYGRSTSATTLTEQLEGSRKRRGGAGFWLAALAVVGAGAWILWPRGGAPTATTPPPSALVSSPAPPAPAPLPMTPIATIELDAQEVDGGGRPSGSRPTAHGTPRPAPVTPASGAGAASAAVRTDGGLSPGARSAAAVMLAPPTSEAPPPPPPPPADEKLPAKE